MAQNGGQKVQTRERILRESSSLLREVGPHAMRINDVMARAGLTHGGFYAHFTSKDDLVAETISDMFARTHAVFLSSIGHSDPSTILRNFVTEYLTLAHRDAADRGCPLPPLAGSVAWLRDEARRRFETGLNSLVIGVSSVLRRLERPDPDADARSIVAEMVGAMALARAMTNPGDAETHFAASRASILARMDLTPAERR